MKVGDYCRTETGQIGKITYFEGDMVRVDCDKFITYKSNHNEITKISPNIIDLIEVGDYVNGHKVLDIYKDINGQVRMKFGENDLVLVYKSNYDNYYLFEKDIKSIVTKEMFTNAEYRVETD